MKRVENARVGARLQAGRHAPPRRLKPGEAGRLVIDHASRIFSQARDLTRDLEELAGLQAPEIALRHRHVRRRTAARRRARAHGDREFAPARARSARRFRRAVRARCWRASSSSPSPTRPAPSGTRPASPSSRWRSTACSSSRGRGTRSPPASDLSLATILVFPLVVVARSAAHRRARRQVHAASPRSTATPATSSPSLMLDSFAVAKAAVLAGDAIGLAPLTAIEPELRAGKVALVPFDAPWLHMSYGLFYPRKRSLSRAAQLFVTQLRQVETALQVREQRAVARMNPSARAQGQRPASAAAKAAGVRATKTARRKPATRRR
ncbi:MAG: LysR substrate-binding domain-containing protein [Comamonadaceae bacterium]|nr:LysR substrate-binding domain-containing protein [Comamonadaceae bacterium]